MRFIDRSLSTYPRALQSKDADAARKVVEDFIEQTRMKGGTRRPPRADWFDEDPEVRGFMHTHFGGLCAYCESEAPLDSEGVGGIVGRHRPAGLAEDEEGKTDLLAYVWLLYDWENLLWLCPECTRLKKNLFFVEGPRGTPSMSVGTLRASERELMLDPCYHQAAEHLIFNVGGAISWRTSAGHATLDTLELNRSTLRYGRRDAVRLLEKKLQVLGPSSPWLREQATLAESLRDPDDPDVLPPHSGGATWAVLEFARTQDMDFVGVDGFLEAYVHLDTQRREAFHDELQERTVIWSPEDAASESVQIEHRSSRVRAKSSTNAKAKVKKRNRVPNIHTLPNALKPITRVKIDNFKALRSIAFDLPDHVPDPEQSPCMLLLGENAMGKSSVLEAMALAVIGASEAAALDDVLKDEDISPMGLIHRPDPYYWEQTADDMCVELGFLDSPTQVNLEAKAGDTEFSGSSDCAKVVLAYGPRRYFTSRTSRRLRAPAHRVRSLFDPMDMIANPIHWLTTLEDPAFFAAARALREVLMLDDEDDFERDSNPDTPGQIYIWQNGQRVAMKDLSVGFKSIIAMVTDIIREMLYHFDNLEFASGVVFVDEIETHLHPRWKMRIMTLLRRAFPQVQFIVTTHDPLCLQGMYDGEVFVLQRAPETDHVEPVSDLPSIRGMRAEQILTSEFFGLGSTDPETDARLARYNHLAARIEDLSEVEKAELERLRKQLDDGMVLGSTLREQAYAEALKERNAARDVSPTRARSPRRADLKTEFASLFETDADP